MADSIADRIETAALRSLHENCPPQLRDRLGLEWIEVDGGAASISAREPSILLNRTPGFLNTRTVSAETIERLAALYRNRGVSGYFLNLYDASLEPAARTLLDGPRFQRRRSWMKFRATPGRRDWSAAIRIERATGNESTTFGQIVCTAFELQPESADLVAALVDDRRWHLLLARCDGKPAGTGALFVADGVGWTDFGATDPAFRRRGVQSALLAARLDLAAQLGCRAVYTETGEAVPGDPQHSYRNILKSGFVEIGSRANYAPAG